MVGLIAAIALPVLAVHLSTTLLARALRVYSPSMLEALSEARGHPQRAEAVMAKEEATALAADLAATATAIVLVGLLAWADYATQSPPWALSFVSAGLVAFAIARVVVHVLAHAHADSAADPPRDGRRHSVRTVA